MEEKKINEAQAAERTTSQENENVHSFGLSIMTSVTMYRVCPLWATAIRTLFRPSLSALAGSMVSDSVGMMFDKISDNKTETKLMFSTIFRQ